MLLFRRRLVVVLSLVVAASGVQHQHQQVAVSTTRRSQYPMLYQLCRWPWTLWFFRSILFGRRREQHLPAGKATTLKELRIATTRARRSAAKHGMPLDDGTLCRYLEAAGWTLSFPDRSVASAIEDTVAWRERTPAARSPAHPDDAVLRVTPIISKRNERVLALRPAKRSAKWWTESLVSAVEIASRSSSSGSVCVVVDCANTKGSELLEAAKNAAPTFPVLSTHYPGRLGRVIVLKAAPTSRACWWFVRNLLDEKTRRKIDFVDNSQALSAALGIDHRRVTLVF